MCIIAAVDVEARVRVDIDDHNNGVFLIITVISEQQVSSSSPVFTLNFTL